MAIDSTQGRDGKMSRHLRRAWEHIEEAERQLALAKEINDRLQHFFEVTPKPSEQWNGEL